jgi:hypothetical protein
MTGEQEIEIGMRRLAEDFRGVRDEDRERIVRNPRSRLLDIVHAIEMGIVDAREMDLRAAALDGRALIDQHPDCTSRRIVETWLGANFRRCDGTYRGCSLFSAY